MRQFWLSLVPALVVPALALPYASAASLLNSGALPSSGTMTNCTGVLSGREIFGDLLVPAGRNCTLDNTVVTGNVMVSKGSGLIVRNSNVQGALKTEAGYARLALSGAIVGGSLSAIAGGSINIDDSQLVGTVNLQRNTGNIRITRVTLNNDLNCAGNRTMPTGTWLQVDGVQTGQCRRL